jgi:hypothetical protein
MAPLPRQGTPDARDEQDTDYHMHLAAACRSHVITSLTATNTDAVSLEKRQQQLAAAFSNIVYPLTWLVLTP